MQGKMSLEDHAAVFMILQLAEQGRPVETLAQFLASYVASGGSSWAEAFRTVGEVFYRADNLLQNEMQIWDGLLPGGADPNAPEFDLVVKRDPNGETRVMVVAMTTPRGHGWIVYGLAECAWYIWNAGFFTNVSHPDSDQLSEGMIINVPLSDLQVQLPYVVADMMCAIKQS